MRNRSRGQHSRKGASARFAGQAIGVDLGQDSVDDMAIKARSTSHRPTAARALPTFCRACAGLGDSPHGSATFEGLRRALEASRPAGRRDAQHSRATSHLMGMPTPACRRRRVTCKRESRGAKPRRRFSGECSSKIDRVLAVRESDDEVGRPAPVWIARAAQGDGQVRRKRSRPWRRFLARGWRSEARLPTAGADTA